MALALLYNNYSCLLCGFSYRSHKFALQIVKLLVYPLSFHMVYEYGNQLATFLSLSQCALEVNFNNAGKCTRKSLKKIWFWYSSHVNEIIWSWYREYIKTTWLCTYLYYLIGKRGMYVFLMLNETFTPPALIIRQKTLITVCDYVFPQLLMS